VVVLGDSLTQPAVILCISSLPGLAISQRRIILGHSDQALQDEPGLDGHRFLAPEGAVVVEDPDPLPRRHIGAPAPPPPARGPQSRVLPSLTRRRSTKAGHCLLWVMACSIFLLADNSPPHRP